MPSSSFFKSLPTQIHQETVDLLSLKTLGRMAQLDKEINALVKETSSDYVAILKGYEIVNQTIKNTDCDFIYIPSWPMDKNLNDFLLQDLNCEAMEVLALVNIEDKEEKLPIPNLFYVDKVRQTVINAGKSNPYRTKILAKDPPQPFVPQKNMTTFALGEFGIHDYKKIKKVLSHQDVLYALGKQIITLQEALKLYTLGLLTAATNKYGVYALTENLITVAEIITPFTAPPLPPGFVALLPEMRELTYILAHRNSIHALLTEVGVAFLKKKFITVAQARTFFENSTHARDYDPGHTLINLLSHPGVLTAFENDWITLASAASLAINGSLSELLTKPGLALLKFIYEEKDKTFPLITITEVANFEWGYQLKELMKSPYFMPALRQNKIRFSQLLQVQNTDIRLKLLSALQGFINGYFTIAQLNALTNVNWFTPFVTQNAMQAFAEELMTMQNIVELARVAVLTDREGYYLQNINYLLDENFNLLSKRHLDFQTGVEAFSLESKSEISVNELHDLIGTKYYYNQEALDSTSVNLLLEHVYSLSTQNIDCLALVAERLEYYRQEMSSILTGMTDEYSSAKDVVRFSIRELNEILEILNSYRLDHYFLIIKMEKASQIKTKFTDYLKRSLDSSLIKNAIGSDLFASSTLVKNLLSEFEQDQVLGNSLGHIETSLKEIADKDVNDLALNRLRI